MSKILCVLMPNYRDEEFTVPHQIIIDAGHTVDVAGLIPGDAIGAGGHAHTPNLMFSDLKKDDLKNYDLLMIPGGPGSKKYLWDKKEIQETISYFHENQKPIAAICYAVIAVVQSGILLNKHATVYPTSEAKDIFEEYGVRFSKDGCVSLSAEKIITAQGPKFAKDFGNEILKMLS